MLHEDIIKQMYTDFNNRNIANILKLFDADVEWPNGWEGGYVHGHHEVRDYWTRQWMEIDPVVTPVSFTKLTNGRLRVDVQQVVKDKNGVLIADSMVVHTYTFEGGLVKRMEIEA